MRRIIAIFVLALATFVTTNAQEIKFGARVGVNFSTLSFSDFSVNRYGDEYKYKANTGFRTGFHIGAFVEGSVSSQFLIEGGVSYSQQGATMKSMEETEYNNGRVVRTRKQEFDKNSIIIEQINVPLWFKYNVGGFCPKVGLSLGYLSKIKLKKDNVTVSGDPDKRFDLGIGIGAEYNLPIGLFFDSNFNLGLTNLATKEDDINIKNRVIQIGVGYKF